MTVMANERPTMGDPHAAATNKAVLRELARLSALEIEVAKLRSDNHVLRNKLQEIEVQARARMLFERAAARVHPEAPEKGQGY